MLSILASDLFEVYWKKTYLVLQSVNSLVK